MTSQESSEMRHEPLSSRSTECKVDDIVAFQLMNDG
jgi:hypothetical protein